MSKLTDMVMRTWAAKRVKDEVADEHKQLQLQAVELCHEAKQTKVVFDADERQVTGTLVEGVNSVLDAEALRDALTPEQWEKITIPVLDKDLLEAHVLTGEISADLVESFTEIRPRAAFLKFTEKAQPAQAVPVKKARKGGKKAS